MWNGQINCTVRQTFLLVNYTNIVLEIFQSFVKTLRLADKANWFKCHVTSEFHVSLSWF